MCIEIDGTGVSARPAEIADTPTPRHPDTPAPRYPDTPAPRHLGTPAPRHPDTPTPRYPDTQTPRHPDTQTPRHLGTPTPRHPGTPTPRHPDTPTPRYPRHPDTQTPWPPAPRHPGTPAPRYPGTWHPATPATPATPAYSPTEPPAPARSITATSLSHLSRRTRRPHARPGHHFNIAACALPLSSTRSRVVLWHLPDQHRANRSIPASACAPLRPGGTEDLQAPAGGCAGLSSTLSRKPPNSQPHGSGGEDRRCRVRADPIQARTVLSTRVPGRRQPTRDGLVFVTVAVLRQSTPCPWGVQPPAVLQPGRSNPVTSESRKASLGGGHEAYRVCERQVPKGIRGKYASQ